MILEIIHNSSERVLNIDSEFMGLLRVRKLEAKFHIVGKR